MATLVVYQGEAIDREVDLGDKTLTVGRGDDNELVLSDPLKSVSRHHAELRFENGKYSIVDLKSQNGVWVGGRRVSTAELEPGIPVLVGSYKLVLKATESPVATDATVLAPAAGFGAATILITPSQSAHPPAAPRPAASAVPPAPKPTPAPKAPEARAPEATPPPAAKPAPPPPPPPAPVPTPVAVAAKVAEPAQPAKAKAPGKGVSKGVILAVAALLLLATAAGVVLTVLRNRAARPVETAAALPEAPPTTVPPPVETPVTPPVTAAATPPAAPEKPAERPVKVKPAEPAEKAPATDASDARGGTPPPRATPPARGRGRNPGPVAPTVTASAPKPVIPDLTGMFEEARTAMIKGDYLAAIAGFENVLKNDPNFPNATNLLDVARGGARNASQLAVDAGNKAELSADYLGAMKQYERALQLDEKSTSAPEAIRRLKVRMQREGEAAFASAKQYDAGDRAKEAIAAYERALQLLPTDHASVPTARDRLAALKR